jgi:hypothetical protein
MEVFGIVSTSPYLPPLGPRPIVGKPGFHSSSARVFCDGKHREEAKDFFTSKKSDEHAIQLASLYT